MSERTLKAAVRKFINKVPQCKVVSYCPYPYGEPGTPDYVGCYKGRMILFELKSDKGKLSPIQAQRIKEWEACGAKVIVANDINKIKEYLNEEEKDPTTRKD